MAGVTSAGTDHWFAHSLMGVSSYSIVAMKKLPPERLLRAVFVGSILNHRMLRGPNSASGQGRSIPSGMTVSPQTALGAPL